MNELPKIYTKRGDQGRTSLLSGEDVTKDHQRLEVCGSIDELNCQIGFALTLIDLDSTSNISSLLLTIQKQLFSIGSEIAAANQSTYARSDELTLWTKQFEESIDTLTSQLSQLKSFILPGGSPAAAALHICRTVCRRTERALVRLSVQESISPQILTYINRLSDLLFVLSRFVLKAADKPEILWKRDNQ